MGNTIPSLDPRVRRLPLPEVRLSSEAKSPLDQFGTFEVFVMPKEGKPFQHEGIVHAPNLEMAYLLAKEAFTRRFLCVSLYVVETTDVFVSPMTGGDTNVYEQMDDVPASNDTKVNYEIYHLLKRGKQHIQAGTVMAANPTQAITQAKYQFNKGKVVCNVWAIRSENIRFTSKEEMDLWTTLPEKKFRDAGDYKGGEKLKTFLDERQSKKAGV